MLKDLFIEPFEDGDFVFGVSSWIGLLIVISIIFLLGVYVIDVAATDTITKDAIVIDKYYKDGTTLVYYQKLGNVDLPTITDFPDEYIIVTKSDSLILNVSVPLTQWFTVKINDEIKVTYKVGRLSKTLYGNKIE
jgi:hypothetical protein